MSSCAMIHSLTISKKKKTTRGPGPPLVGVGDAVVGMPLPVLCPTYRRMLSTCLRTRFTIGSGRGGGGVPPMVECVNPRSPQTKCVLSKQKVVGAGSYQRWVGCPLPVIRRREPRREEGITVDLYGKAHFGSVFMIHNPTLIRAARELDR